MRKRRWLAGLMALVLIVTLIPASALGASVSTLPFGDVVGGPYELPVAALFELGVVNGTSATTFSPDAAVTRAQMAAFLMRALNKSEDAKSTSFSQKFNDVRSGQWYFGDVMMAESLGIVRGMSATTFEPNARVTYPQAVVMALRALGYDDGTMVYPGGYVLKAQELGMLADLRNWSLSGEMNRGEVAALLAAAVFKVKHHDLDKTLSQAYFKHVTTLEIRPAGGMLTAGATKLEAVGKDAYGMDINGISGMWRVLQGSATISTDGVLNAQRGNVTVEASVGTLVATRDFQILSGITVSPESAAVKPGDTLNLKAFSADQVGQQVDGVTWSVVSGNATVTQDGRLTFNGTGRVTVKAALSTLQKTVTYEALSGLTIEPSTATTTVGDTVKFKAKLPDGTAYTGPVKWSVEGAGTITPDGVYTAAAGSVPVVKATAGELSASASVKVIHRLVVEPGPSVAIAQSKTQQFTAKGVTTAGEDVALTATWTSSGRTGIIDGSGLFVATASGTGTVTAKYGSLQQNVSVSVSGEPASVTLTASRTNFPANGHSPVTLTATVRDLNGIPVAMTTPVQFFLNDSTKGTLDATTVNAVNGVATATLTPSTTVGAMRVTAAASDLAVVSGYVDLSSFAPTPAKIRLEANPSTIAAAVNSRAVVSAVLVDSEGYEITNSTGTNQTVTLSFVNTTAAYLSSSTVTIGTNQSRGDVVFNAGNSGATVISGSAGYPVESVTIRALQAGPAAKVVIRPGIVDTKADGSADMLVYAEVQDMNGVVRTQDYGVPVVLQAVSTDGTISLPAQSQATQFGVATFRVRSTKSGTFTFTALSSALQSGTAQGTFVAGTATGLKLSVTPVSDIAADGKSQVKLRAEIVDANGNLVPSAGGLITFARTQNMQATTMPANTSVQTTNGVAELPLTASIYPGTDKFKVTMVGMAESSEVSVSARITGVPAQVIAEVATSAVLVGTPVQVKVYVQDSRGYTVTGATGLNVRLVANSPTATVTGSGLTESGVAVFTVTDTTAGVVKLSATSDGLTADNARAVQYNVGAAARVALKVASQEMSADNGVSYTQLTADVQDAYGNTVSQAVPVTLSLNRSDIVSISSTQMYTGNFVLVRSTGAAGAVTISGSSTIPVTPVTLNTYVPGAPTKIRVDQQVTGPAGSQITFRVRVIDNFGHALTSLTTGANASAVGLILTGSSGTSQVISNTNVFGLPGFTANGSTTGSAPLTSGVATFTYLNNKAETVTATPVFYYNGGQLPPESGTITTTPGTPVQLSVTAARTGLSSATLDSTLIDAVLLDMYGNPVTMAAADTFTFSLDTSAYLTTNGPLSINTVSGKATIQVTSKIHDVGGSTTIRVTSAKTGLSRTVTVVTDRPPTQPILYASDAMGTDNIIGAGETSARIVVTVEARNSTQTVVVYVNGIQVNVYSSATGSTLANTIPASQTTFIGYIHRSDLGGTGQKNVRVVVQNSVGPSPMSNAQTLIVQ